MESFMKDGKEVKIGDYVGFKYDIEQSGPVTKIENRYGKIVVHVTAKDGGYVMDRNKGVNVILELDEIWID